MSKSLKPKHAWLAIDRVEPPKRPAASRVGDFQRTYLPYDEATAQEQARRCIQCPKPVCIAACPTLTPITELLALTADGQFEEAARLFFTAHCIPEIASHTCLGGRACERACLLSGKTDAVPIRAITRFLMDYGWKHGLVEPPLAMPKGRRVAVLGSGIGGLVAADLLSRHGYTVTVYDSRPQPGGRVMNGLPGFRVDKELAARRISMLRQRGVRFEMGVTFGQQVRLTHLRQENDAVFLCPGRAEIKPLSIPGAGLRGVWQAFPYICQHVPPACDTDVAPLSRPAEDGLPETSGVNVRGKRVVVLGAGDTAMDTLRIAIRNGALDVLCVCRRDAANSSADQEEYEDAVEEGARFEYLTKAIALRGDAAGNVIGVRCVRMALGEPDLTGRLTVQPLPDSEFDLPADAVFVAYGFAPPKLPQTDDFALLTLDGRGCLLVDQHGMTNLPGVFAGGSIVRGSVSLCHVVLDSRSVAVAIDRYLAATPARA